MPRGGKREGTPGVGYSNRTDLGQNYQPQTGTTTAAAGGQTAPAAPPQRTLVTPDMIPKLNDPSGRPGEPVTTGLNAGAGAGPAAIGGVPPNPQMSQLRAAYLANPTPELERALRMMSVRFGKL